MSDPDGHDESEGPPAPYDRLISAHASQSHANLGGAHIQIAKCLDKIPGKADEAMAHWELAQKLIRRGEVLLDVAQRGVQIADEEKEKGEAEGASCYVNEEPQVVELQQADGTSTTDLTGEKRGSGPRTGDNHTDAERQLKSAALWDDPAEDMDVALAGDGPFECIECNEFKLSFKCGICSAAPVCVDCLSNKTRAGAHECMMDYDCPKSDQTDKATHLDAPTWRTWVWNGSESEPPGMCAHCYWLKNYWVSDCPACRGWVARDKEIPRVSLVFRYIPAGHSRLPFGQRLINFIPVNIRAALTEAGFNGAEVLAPLANEPWTAMRDIWRQLDPDGHDPNPWHTMALLGTWWGSLGPMATELVNAKAVVSNLIHAARQSTTASPSTSASSPSTNPVVFAPAQTKTAIPRFSSRRRLKLSKAPDKRTKDEIEEEEKRRWLLEIISFIEEAKLPSAAMASGSLDPAKAMQQVTGGARSKTIRARARKWGAVRLWLKATFGLPWPVVPVWLTDYLEMRASEPCAFNEINDTVAALYFIEKAGGVKPEDRISTSAWVQDAMRDMEKSLAQGIPYVKRKAPNVHVSQIVEWEREVMNFMLSAYWRYFAGLKLMKVWTSSRHDDALGVRRAGYRIMPKTGSHVTYDRTKTTGPGKKVRTTYGYITELAWVEQSKWLENWHQVIQSKEFTEVDVDCLLAMPNHDFTGICEAFPEYHKIVTLSAQHNSRLLYTVPNSPAPAGWLSPQWLNLVLTSEHRERGTLPSWAVHLGFNETQIDMLGRWRPKASGESIRNQKAVVRLIQGKVAETMRAYYNGIIDYSFIEDPIKATIMDEVKTRHPEVTAEEVAFGISAIFPNKFEFRAPTRFHIERQRGPETTLADTIEISDNEVERRIEIVKREERAVEIKEDASELTHHSFWASLGPRGKPRTLHVAGGCPKVRDVDVKRWIPVDLDPTVDKLGGCAQACRSCFGTSQRARKRAKVAKVEASEAAKEEDTEKKDEPDLTNCISSSESTSTEGDGFGADLKSLQKEVEKRLEATNERHGRTEIPPDKLIN